MLTSPIFQPKSMQFGVDWLLGIGYFPLLVLNDFMDLGYILHHQDMNHKLVATLQFGKVFALHRIEGE